MDREGVMVLLQPAPITAAVPHLTPVWLDAGYNVTEKGKEWLEKGGWTTRWRSRSYGGGSSWSTLHQPGAPSAQSYRAAG
jgi:hypothetical protein